MSLTQTQLAQRCGLARGSIANIESGNQRPTLHTLWLLADALKVDMSSLIPSREEVPMSEVSAASIWLVEEAGESQKQVTSFIVKKREEANSNVTGKKS